MRTAGRGRVVVSHLGVGLADLVFADAILQRAARPARAGPVELTGRTPCASGRSWVRLPGVTEARGELSAHAGRTFSRLDVLVPSSWSSSSRSAAWHLDHASGAPQTTGASPSTGSRHPYVIRDAAGIAQINADTPHDLFLAQGYVHAQERLWQMEVWRHISAGRLSELFGKSTLADDRFIRTLGWRQAAERDLAALSPEARAPLDAYADGVNAYIDGHGASSGSRSS